MNMNTHPRRVAGRPCRLACLLIFAVCSATALSAGNWHSLPMTVHEWGVNAFDWNADDRLVQELPDYLYTDKKPGTPIAKPEKRVRDLPADSGVRYKPILYFYTPEKYNIEKPPQVAVEMRFAFGHANAWWPQVNQYRTEEMTRRVEAPDWNAWKQQALKKYERWVKANPNRPAAVERWESELAIYNQLAERAQIAWLSNRLRSRGTPDYPEDGRMQLIWDKLTLHNAVPEGQSLPGENLADDHWVKVAREVDAAYVSNGGEAERYLFYEGKTREQPAIAILPSRSGMKWLNWLAPSGDDREVAVVNVSEYAIYDVVAVYRDRDKGIRWTSYMPMLPALPRDQPKVDQVTALRVPDFDQPTADDEIKLNPESFDRRTRGRLIENLTAGYHYDYGDVTMRDPADPQPPTKMHQLFKKEAVALEKIWHDDFFESEGLTVLYRESPAYLDEAMPLNIYTSMYWYVKLSRCGLVLNRNIPIDKVNEVHMALRQFESAQYNKTSEEKLASYVEVLKKNRFLTLGMTRYRYRKDGGDFRDYRSAVRKKVEALFD